MRAPLFNIWSLESRKASEWRSRRALAPLPTKPPSYSGADKWCAPSHPRLARALKVWREGSHQGSMLRKGFRLRGFSFSLGH